MSDPFPLLVLAVPVVGTILMCWLAIWLDARDSKRAACRFPARRPEREPALSPYARMVTAEKYARLAAANRELEVPPDAATETHR